jgi:hypothetical protein
MLRREKEFYAHVKIALLSIFLTVFRAITIPQIAAGVDFVHLTVVSAQKWNVPVNDTRN